MTRLEKLAADLPLGMAGAAAPDGSDEAAVDFGPLTGLAGFMLRLAQLRIFESFFRDFGATGITPGLVGILVALERNPGIRQGVLADALRIKWSNMAKIVRQLQADGLLERRVPASDRRAVELHLTDKGRDLVARTVPRLDGSDRAATAMLSERERATLLRLLAKVVAPQPARPS